MKDELWYEVFQMQLEIRLRLKFLNFCFCCAEIQNKTKTATVFETRYFWMQKKERGFAISSKIKHILVKQREKSELPKYCGK